MTHMPFRPISGLIDHRQDGFALLSVTIMLGIITASASVLVSYALTTRNAGKFLEADYDALQIAEAGLQKALFCLKATSDAGCGGTYGDTHVGQANVPFGNGTFSTTVVVSGSEKLITSLGITAMNRPATVGVILTTDTAPEKDATFDYAIQVGNGGLTMTTGVVVNNGSVYSDSDIDCKGGATVTRNIFVSKIGGGIINCDVSGDVHADKVKDSEVIGDVYYKDDPIDITGTSVGGTKYPNSLTPLEIDLPTLDLAIWRQAAENGGVVSGDYSPSNGESLGPKKIDGNLTLPNGVDITLTGPLWVTGDVFTDNNSSITLDSRFGIKSTVILADNYPNDISLGGKIRLDNGSETSGSGTDGSFILFISTNDGLLETDPAVEVGNKAGGSLILAMNGLANFLQNSDVAAIAAKKIIMRNNAILNYDNEGLTAADAVFWTGETGDWRVREHSWRRL